MRKIILLFFAVLLSGMAHAQGAEMVNRANYWGSPATNSKGVMYNSVLSKFTVYGNIVYKKADEETTPVAGLLSDNGFWVYVNTEVRSEPESGNVLDGRADCMYNVEKSHVRIEGREYGVLKRVTAPAGICTPEIVRTFHVRESEGRVYGRKDEYVQMMSDVFGIQESDLFLEEWYGGEVLLYDFTLEAGDRYPCKGSVTVVAVDRVTTRDGVVRKLLSLSNGQRILEDIGCISSGSELLSYQNMGLGHRQIWDTPYAHGVYTYGGLMEYRQFENGYDEEGTQVYEKGDVKQSVSFLEEGKEWLYKSSAPSLADWSLRYQIQGDTVVDGHVGKKVYLTEERNGSTNEPTFMGMLCEDGQRVYFSGKDSSDPQLLYDFSLQAGDRAMVACFNKNTSSVNIEIVKTDSIEVNGIRLKVLQYKSDFRPSGDYGGWWIEGVGDYRSLIPAEYWSAFTVADASFGGEHVSVLPALREKVYSERRGYSPMLVQGRRWRYKLITYSDTGSSVESSSIFDYVIDGDTLIGHTPCKKMYIEQETGTRQYQGAWHEEDRKVSVIDAGTSDPYVLYDFGLIPSEMSIDPELSYLSHVDTIAVGGRLYMRHNLYSYYQGTPITYVEGIGSPNLLWPYPSVDPTGTNRTSMQFMGVYNGDKCAFSMEDFDKGKYTDGILPVATPRRTNHDNGIYDLQGRRIQGNGVTGSQGDGQLPRGVYIQNGRKFVVR